MNQYKSRWKFLQLEANMNNKFPVNNNDNIESEVGDRHENIGNVCSYRIDRMQETRKNHEQIFFAREFVLKKKSICFFSIYFRDGQTKFCIKRERERRIKTLLLLSSVILGSQNMSRTNETNRLLMIERWNQDG